MATGVMALAYLGELAVAVNLAYVALEKTRYLQIAEKRITKNKDQFDIPTTVPDPIKKELLAISDRVEKLFSDVRRERQRAWNHIDGNDSTHHDFLAGKVFDFFEKEYDKSISEKALLFAGAGIVGMTVMPHLNIDFPYMWEAGLFLFMVAIIVPLAFIAAGRRMTKILILCAESARKEFSDALARVVVPPPVNMQTNGQPQNP